MGRSGSHIKCEEVCVFLVHKFGSYDLLFVQVSICDLGFVFPLKKKQTSVVKYVTTKE